MTPPRPERRPGASLITFLAMAFAVVGLTGILATYAAPLPLARALREEALVDDALASGRGNEIDALAARLAKDDEARFGGAVVVDHGADLPARAAALRAALRRTMTAEADAAAWRLRFLIIVATIAGALFGAALMGARRR